MSGKYIRAGGVLAVALFALAAFDGAANHVIPGVAAGEYQAKPKAHRHARRHVRRGTVRQGSTPEEIAKYFQLYGGFLDPAINKQSQGGPFDSGFFFDSGIGPNGGDSPYMN
jgi:hypothetical protein